MTKAPERIWLEVEPQGLSMLGQAWTKRYEAGYIEYIRADLYEVTEKAGLWDEEIKRKYKAKIESLQAQLAEAQAEIERLSRGSWCGCGAWIVEEG